MPHTPGPWTAELQQARAADTTYFDVCGPDGKVLFDTSNSEAMCIEADHDEDGSHYWDEQGRLNTLLAAAAPELLAACQAHQKWEAEENNPLRTHAQCVALLTDADNLAQAAIKKATGK
jgi:hypothetical protein